MSIEPGSALAIHRGRRPDADAWFVREVVETWHQEYRALEGEGREFALPDTKWRGSWAGSCGRQVAYQVAGVPETNPTTVADSWRFWIGKLLHDKVQEQVLARFPGSTVEGKVRIGQGGSGHFDILVVTPEGKRILVELKSINGTGYKMSVLGQRAGDRNPNGARVSAIMQGAMYAASVDPLPDELVIAYFALELISQPGNVHYLADEYQRFAAQWTFSQEDYLLIARQETRRLDNIVSIVERFGPGGVPRVMPDPSMPVHVVTNPRNGKYDYFDDKTGDWLGSDRCWQCNYCSHQDQCAADADAEAEAKAKRP